MSPTRCQKCFHRLDYCACSPWPDAPQPPAKSCLSCVHSLRQDTGYSNYTVEGRDFYCLIGKHPADGFDAWYGTDDRLGFAAECPSFEEGEGLDIDVERELYDALDAADKARYDAWETNQ